MWLIDFQYSRTQTQLYTLQKKLKGATKGKVVIACPGDIQLKEDCSNLFSVNEDYIYEPDPFTGTVNFSGVDTSMARSMESMFMDCKAKHLDLSGFNTSKVTNMRKMFKDCKNLQSINLSSFNTERVTGMEFLFTRCCSLEHIDLSILYVEAGYVERLHVFEACLFTK